MDLQTFFSGLHPRVAGNHNQTVVRSASASRITANHNQALRASR